MGRHQQARCSRRRRRHVRHPELLLAVRPASPAGRPGGCRDHGNHGSRGRAAAEEPRHRCRVRPVVVLGAGTEPATPWPIDLRWRSWVGVAGSAGGSRLPARLQRHLPVGPVHRRIHVLGPATRELAPPVADVLGRGSPLDSKDDRPRRVRGLGPARRAASLAHRRARDRDRWTVDPPDDERTWPRVVGVAVFEPRVPTLVNPAAFVDCARVARVGAGKHARRDVSRVAARLCPTSTSASDRAPGRSRRSCGSSGLHPDPGPRLRRPDEHARRRLPRGQHGRADRHGAPRPSPSSPSASTTSMPAAGPSSFNLYDEARVRWLYGVAGLVRCGSGRWLHAQLPWANCPRGVARRRDRRTRSCRERWGSHRP